MTTHEPHSTLFATSAFGGVWTVGELLRHGPTWAAVPPLLFSVAALIGAARSWLDGAQARRHADERHRAELARLRCEKCPTGGASS